jgi:hypothetical protein
MAPQAHPTRTPKPEATWELVLKRNPVERLKQERSPLGRCCSGRSLPTLVTNHIEIVTHLGKLWAS